MLEAVLALPFPAIDPVALRIGPVLGWGPIQIKWYGLAYMGGLLLGWLYLRRLLDQPELWSAGRAPFTREATEDLLLMMTFGIIIGGRLGHVLLYHPAEYLRDPLEILRVWNGGMSFHGGLAGAGIAAWLFALRTQAPVLSVFDACAAVVPFGLFFGRTANFINGEYWGTITSAPWGIVFPDPAAGLFARHPSQLYEALLEGLALFVVLRILTHKQLGLRSPGKVTGAFLIGYGAARIFCELFREPEEGAPFNLGWLTTGMAYSLPMIALGLWFIRRARETQVAPARSIR